MRTRMLFDLDSAKTQALRFWHMQPGDLLLLRRSATSAEGANRLTCDFRLAHAGIRMF